MPPNLTPTKKKKYTHYNIPLQKHTPTFANIPLQTHTHTTHTVAKATLSFFTMPNIGGKRRKTSGTTRRWRRRETASRGIVLYPEKKMKTRQINARQTTNIDDMYHGGDDYYDYYDDYYYDDYYYDESGTKEHSHNTTTTAAMATTTITKTKQKNGNECKTT